MMSHRKKVWIPLFAVAFVATACADTPTDTETAALATPAFSAAGTGSAAENVAAELNAINARLEAEGAPMRVGKAEIIYAVDGEYQSSNTIYANNRTKQLATRFVPNDARRAADGDNITWLIDEDRSTAYTRASYPARESLVDALATTFAPWQGLACTGMQIVRRPDTGIDPSIVDDGVGQWWAADIVEAGFRPLAPGVLGVTYTYWFTSGGQPTDINADGRYDTALKEIWYNLNYYWSRDGSAGAIDLPSVAIHENGHALEIGHFGLVFQGQNGKLHFSPRASMNALYFEPDRNLYGTDEASFCSNFASWPN